MNIDQYNNLENIQKMACFEAINKFIYFGSLITNRAGCNKVGHCEKLNDESDISEWCNNAISQINKLKLVPSIILPIAMYDTEMDFENKR